MVGISFTTVSARFTKVYILEGTWLLANGFITMRRLGIGILICFEV